MSLLTRRIRGVRVLDMIALGLLIALVLSVYLAKTIAGRERTEIASVERQIAAEHDRIRLLQAEVSHLERPERIEQLSVNYLGLAPISAKRETTPEGLSEVARGQPVKAQAQAQAMAAQTLVAPPALAAPQAAPTAEAQPAGPVAALPISGPPRQPAAPKGPTL